MRTRHAVSRTVLFSLVTCLFVAACGGHDSATQPSGGGGGNFAQSADVFMTLSAFSPFQTDIAVGGTVRYNFGSDAHNVIFRAAAGKPQDVLVTQNVVVPRTFGTAGTFLYDCTIHPGMTGQVVVH